ncbi:MAG: metallophosphoesterase [Armatimonadota bacterium]|nr:metallophosphoesterase [Armatimonadota bacterium]MCX7777610.1 metallophosphoesterase [Armatimonadota bacterium]MDW8024712.1 metallophosphoesterase [Armatimonadota bacterium]
MKRRQMLWTLLLLLASLVYWFAHSGVEKLTFVVYGDVRTNHDVHRAIVAQILKFKPAFILCTGDLVSRGSVPEQWKTFFEIIKPIMDEKIPYIPAKGNHDIDSGTGLWAKAIERLNLKPNTGNPNYFSVQFGNLHFAILDSNSILEDDAQIRWLEREMGASKSLHKFVVFHHPLFTLIERRAASAERFRRRLQPVFNRLKICAAFTGHDHHFYLTKREGVTYITTGGGGAPLYDFDPNRSQKGDSFLKAYHFITIEVEEQSVKATVIGMNGERLKLEGKGENPFNVCSH